jgi:hypothetical protein
MELGAGSEEFLNSSSGRKVVCDFPPVGAGFTPAFKFKQRLFVLVIERRREARAYEIKV